MKWYNCMKGYLIAPTAVPSKKDQSIQATSIENTIVSMQLKASVEVKELAMISWINLTFALKFEEDVISLRFCLHNFSSFSDSATTST